MSALEELEQAIGQVAGQVGGAVVGIGRGWGRGSGVVVADGRVVTNAHNLRGDQVTVVFADGRSVTGQVSGVDVDGDLAVVAVDTGGATPVGWADEASSVGVGSVVFALANPGGRPRVTTRLAWPGSCAARSACPIARACWSGSSRRAARRATRASRPAT